MKSFPKGLTAEIISLESLKKVCNLTNKSFDLEHITHYIYKNHNLFNIYSYEQKKIGKILIYQLILMMTLKGLNGLSQILIVYHLKQAFKRFYYLVKFGIKRKYLI